MTTINTWVCSGLLLASAPCFAGWPTFSVPSPSSIQMLVQTSGCPKDTGRIVVGSKLPIVNHYIPSGEHWYWEYKGDGECQRLTGNLYYVGFHQSGDTAGHDIEVDYGISQSDILYRFVFPINGSWDCGALYPGKLPLDMGCAKDTDLI